MADTTAYLHSINVGEIQSLKLHFGVFRCVAAKRTFTAN